MPDQTRNHIAAFVKKYSDLSAIKILLNQKQGINYAANLPLTSAPRFHRLANCYINANIFSTAAKNRLQATAQKIARMFHD